MTKKTVKKIFVGTISTFIFLVLVLAIHIYVVTRPKPIDKNTRVMARIDIKDSLNQDDAAKITYWLYQQKGIDHVLVNPKTRIAIFTFFPIQTTGDAIVKNFKSSFSYTASRHIPTEVEIQSGCPVVSTSAGSKIYTYFKHIF